MAKLDVETNFIEKLAELLQRTGLTEIEINQGTTRIRVARQIQMAPMDVTAPVYLQAPQVPPAGPAAAEPAPGPDASHPGIVKSPMVGTVYLAPEPGMPPYAGVGSEVKEGQTLLIIEAMKVMNAIRAPKAGRVLRVFVENAAPVEFGEPLLVLE
ncbi:MAG TPA: acetyl-CoA carboxylase biotin carboxyl carrier protein [Geminicoccus sp.]|uniref:acetyl-CoA carboxylase biotin carboxyl carrier protein n=1 Tax=Geminicoccus sp. TaxID=2024832 RepID=UPI002E322B81|nr:acetyl-CoA carboxylase biotin carboxyl carrier protein [Geminicoccus sp.]HEX2527785.1 acetyl-CoA carboxylase biotin carboxyl carrier protein [Geminicoccus sp.]